MVEPVAGNTISAPAAGQAAPQAAVRTTQPLAPPPAPQGGAAAPSSSAPPPSLPTAPLAPTRPATAAAASLPTTGSAPRAAGSSTASAPSNQPVRLSAQEVLELLKAQQANMLAQGMRIEQLEASQAAAPAARATVATSSAATFNLPPPAVAAAEGRSDGSSSVPEPVSGFRVDPLQGGVSASITARIRAREFFSLALLLKTGLDALSADDEWVLKPGGTWSKKLPSRDADRSLTLEQWLVGSDIVARVTREECSEKHAAGYDSHLRIVRSVNGRFSWALAREYDILQREALGLDPRHDISVMNIELIAYLSAQSQFRNPAPIPPKRPSEFVAASGVRRVRARVDGAGAVAAGDVGHCFRCGARGHLPRQCQAANTAAGKAVAVIAVGADIHSPNALTGGDGRTYCFGFAKTSHCERGGACRFAHACSICHATAHGAGRCNHAG
ncbi:hypothetical protein PHLGIDRAFT_253714 [Phlebiopsis gigantea 11061_1 CR5-6]|uniref:CCHC-type domain-containing protein n=1 Tax=Phlebiopsis gigantea (strain 11061_1 CR5-6) TaxID=745531 RepID=A0A0C3S1H5_PHLG1|nr:hypothetical protein PHLGIDRAFT_253714 [Phlebiopsis gigantea 11061_1 CR5-6]